MKSYLSLAWKELKKQKVTSFLILLALILSTVATTAVGQSIGILQSMRVEQAASLNGNRYATFHGLTSEQVAILETDPRVCDVGSLINIGYAPLGNSSLTLYLREYCGDALSAYPSIGKIKEGRLPTAAGEVALSTDALQYLGVPADIGSVITLPLEIGLNSDLSSVYEYTGTFSLTGILESNYLGYTSGIVDGIVGEGTATQVLPKEYIVYSTDFKTKSSEQFQAVINALTDSLCVSEENTQYNWILLDALGIPYDDQGASDTDTGFSFMTVACVLIGALLLLAAGLVIYNILKVAVAKRIREYGTLRAIGSSRKQLYLLVTTQLLLLCAIGIPVGLLFGILSAKGILLAVTGSLNPELFMASTTEELNAAINASGTPQLLSIIISIAITLLFAIGAAFPAARYAARVSPTVAMRGQTAQIKRHNRKQRKIRNFEAYFARLNLKRNRGRTIITIISIVMSITVFVSLQSFSGILDTSQSVKEMHTGDYAITNETTGISKTAVDMLHEQNYIESLATTKLTVWQQDENGVFPAQLDFSLQSWETLHIIALDTERLLSSVMNLSEQDQADLLTGTACFVKNPISFSVNGETAKCTNFEVGDRLTVNGQELRVVGIIESPITINNAGFTNGVQIIGIDALYDAITGQDYYSEVYPTLSAEVDSDTFEKWLDEWCQENPGTHWLSYQQSDAQLAESFEQINLLCWGLILFIGLIGILNIVNTVYTNIHTRINEIGMQRAIGMSVKSLYNTFLWEGAYYGLIASVIGAILGYVCSVFIGAATTDTLQIVAIPIIPILQATVVSVIACLIATALPLHSISKMSVVRSIVAVE